MPRRLSLSATAAVLAAAAALGAAAPAGAVIGGSPVDPASVPWYADVGICGGTLIAPDRVATAAHCVLDQPVSDLGARIGEASRTARRFAVYPGWDRHANGENVRDDVAIVELTEPVTGVPAVTIGGSARTATIVGRGRTTPPGSRGREDPGSELRSAPLRTMSDAECARTFGSQRGNSGERFLAAPMLCAIDVDGEAPLSSGCNGDSGGPLVAGDASAPVLLGIVSWGGARCGADRLPSVFADARRYRAFLTDPTPTWAPAPNGPARITGTPKVGSVLRCTVPGWAEQPDRIDVLWQRQGGRRALTAGRRASYRVRTADAGRTLVCAISARTAGGVTTLPFTTAAQRKIPR